MRKTINIINNDPSPYDGPIERADGERPFNHYLWPTESWWANRELSRCIDSRWHFGIVALADGRFSTEGSVYSIEENDCFGKPCVFATRELSIRVAAARMIRQARNSQSWSYGYGGLKGKELAAVINWALEVIARETGKQPSRKVHVKELPSPQPKTGLPLFDFYSCSE